jgi:hypothetical protein
MTVPRITLRCVELRSVSNGAAFRQPDATDHLAVGGEDGHAVLGLAAGKPAPKKTPSTIA